MRNLTIITAFSTVMLAATQAHGQFGPDSLSVGLNKTQILRLPQAASAVLIGNPDIADVSVHSVDTLLIVGRGYGETNLIVLDRSGKEIVDSDITVVNNLPSHGVRLFNAKSRETYSCIPNCQPSPVLGDAPGFIGQNTNTQAPLAGSSGLVQGSSNFGGQGGIEQINSLAGEGGFENDGFVPDQGSGFSGDGSSGFGSGF